MKRYLMTLGVCLWCFSCAIAQTANETASAGQDVETIKAQRRAFLCGAEAYFGKMFGDREQQYTHAMSSIDTYIDFFANQNFDSVPKWETPALNFAKEGVMDKALEIYEGQHLLDKYTPGSPLISSIERQVMLLQISGIRQRSRDGLDILERVAAIDTTSLRIMPMLIQIGLDLHLHSLVDEYIYMFLGRAEGDPEMTAAVLAQRALVEYRRNRPNDALVYGRRAEVMFDSLQQATQNPKVMILERAHNYFNLSRIYDRLGQGPQVISSIRACRNSYALEGESGHANLLERIHALNTLAPLAADQNGFFLADSMYNEIDQLGAWLFEGNVFQQSQFFFNSMRLRGLVCYRVGKYDEGGEYFERALAVLNQMEDLNPGQNQEAFQNIYFNMASLYYVSGNMEKALEMNRQVLKMVQNGNFQDEMRKKTNLAFCYKYIGNCLWALGYQKYLASNKKKTKEVMRYYTEATESYQTAMGYNPRDTEAISKYNLGDLILSGMEKPMAMPKNF